MSGMVADIIRPVVETVQEVQHSIDESVVKLSNAPAPEYWVSFMIGGVLAAIGIVQTVRNFQQKRNADRDASERSAVTINDGPVLAVLKFSAQSFLYLGALQLMRGMALGDILALVLCGDMVGLFLGWFGHEPTRDAVVVTDDNASSTDHSTTKNTSSSHSPKDSKYEWPMAVGVFIAQCVFIVVVVVDVLDSSNAGSADCRGEATSCAVVDKFGSWGMYGLGTILTCVFVLILNTRFTRSKQDETSWRAALPENSKANMIVTWNDPVTRKVRHQPITSGDVRTWLPFAVSYWVHGAGFHILVHALPLQVALQSSFTSVMFRVISMMYLLDLYHIPGYTLRMMHKRGTPSTVADKATIIEVAAAAAVGGDHEQHMSRGIFTDESSEASQPASPIVKSRILDESKLLPEVAKNGENSRGLTSTQPSHSIDSANLWHHKLNEASRGIAANSHTDMIQAEIVHSPCKSKDAPSYILRKALQSSIKTLEGDDELAEGKGKGGDVPSPDIADWQESTDAASKDVSPLSLAAGLSNEIKVIEFERHDSDSSSADGGDENNDNIDDGDENNNDISHDRSIANADADIRGLEDAEGIPPSKGSNLLHSSHGSIAEKITASDSDNGSVASDEGKEIVYFFPAAINPKARFGKAHKNEI